MLQLDFTPFPELETERLLLRKITKEDTSEIYFLRSDEAILKFIGKEPAKNFQEAEDFINRINENVLANTGIMWGITLKDNAQEIIGTICYWRIQNENYRAEIGYVLHPAFWKRGLMKEAINKVAEYGFNTMHLHSIEARIHAENMDSASVLEATGFTKNGCLKEEFFFREKFHDTIIYSRLQQ
jgi:[ribosomal protein S5]-alanine N-acetyltransferase